MEKKKKELKFIEKSILELIGKEKKLNFFQIAELTGIDEKMARYHLARLEKDKYIKGQLKEVEHEGKKILVRAYTLAV